MKVLFSEYVNEIRKKKDISMNSLCEGLCTIQEVFYIESGRRDPDILLQEAVLERLGVGAEDYEHFLNYDDYKRWKERHQILHCIIFEKFEEADNLLDKYLYTYVDTEKRDKLERQFYLSMLAQIRSCQGSSREELYKLYSDAICITVPQYDEKAISEKSLSIKELNLMLEAERCRSKGERLEYYIEIVKYINNKKFDRRGRVKIYPKAVYFLCRCAISTSEKSGDKLEKNNLQELLDYCDLALEVLRDNGRMYFLWEILSIRDILLKNILKRIMNDEDGEKGDSGILKNLKIAYLRNRKWKEVLEKIYEEFRVPKESFEFCYLYIIKGVSCINDVIRIRREMLGMSRKELCREICDIKTLRRLENCETSPQKVIVRDLFERLGLSRELTRTELETSSQNAKDLMTRVNEKANDRRWDEVNKLVVKIKELVPMEMLMNQQAIMRKELLMKREKGEIENEDYCRQMQAVLELTLPYEAFLKDGEKYLTHEEQSCIHNMMIGMKREDEELLICMRQFEKLYGAFVDEGLQETVWSMYEMIMSYVGSIWGNREEFDKADYISGIIIEGCLRFRRLMVLGDGLYDRYWNYYERKKRGIPVEKELNGVEEIEKCLLLSKLSKRKNSQLFYQAKLDAMIHNE